MKSILPSKRDAADAPYKRPAGYYALGAMLLFAGSHVRADDSTNAPSAQEMFEGGPETYSNWVELSAGGFFTQGNAAEARQSLHLGNSVFGGIEDLHYEKYVNKTTLFAIDGRSILDNHDYSLSLKVQNDDWGYVRMHFENFRTWYNGGGGYYPPAGVRYDLPDDTLSIDRGEVSFEAGLRRENVPQVTFKYSHRYRDGDKNSTSWGPTHPSGFSTPVAGLSPSFRDIDETVDAFDLGATHHLKTTDFGANLHYETADLNDALKTTLFPGEPTQQKTTTREGTQYDQFSVNAFSETWIRTNMLFSAGVLYSRLDADISGSRIYGNDFDVSYAPNPQQTGLGYTNLLGSLSQNDYVMNLNLMSQLGQHFTVVPSLRVQKQDWDGNSGGWGTLASFPAEQFTAESARRVLDVTEALDLRYTGFTNWVIYGKALWTQGDGDLNERGGLAQVNGFGVPPIQFQKDDSRFFQRYSAGARWYPLRAVTLDAGGYYKNHRYDYNFGQDNTPNTPGSPFSYPGFLAMRGFETYDGSFRVSLRLPKNISILGRYEYQDSTINTRPDPVSGLSEAESARMTTHILALNVTWMPWSRLYLQPGLSYVRSETKTPVSDYVPATLTAAPVLAAQNNYWTADLVTGFVVDDKTDLRIGYFHYRADNYEDNSAAGVPYGAGAEQNGVTATVARRINEHLRLTLRYGYYDYKDETFGGFNDYTAHLVWAGMQYRF